ncbi:MAG: LEA type 2 family protein [Gammaproteobacteria bacterium]
MMIKFEWMLMVFVLWVLTGCASLTQRPEAPKISIAGIQPVTMGLFEQRYLVSLRVKNINQFALPIRGLSFAIEINGIKFGNGVSNQRVDIPALDEGTLDVEISSNLLQSFRQFKGLAAGGFKQFDYKLSGSLALINSALSLPFTVADRFSLAADEKPAAGDAL